MANLAELRQKNIEITRRLIRESVSSDQFIINSVNNIEELQKMQNVMVKRLREWYALYFPELEKKTPDNEEFIAQVIKDDKKHLLSELNVQYTMGADLGDEEIAEMKKLAKTASELYAQEKHLQIYLQKVMENTCKNTMEVASAVIGAKLLRGAGSLRKLAMMRSSTIQLIGAEKALFRHIKTGARPPKYGYLLQHPLVQKSSKDAKGKVARLLADKIFIAARVDFFKGEYIADKLLKEVESKAKIA